MKVAIILSVVLAIAAAQTTRGPQPTRSATEVKQELLQRAKSLQTLVKEEVARLEKNNRGHIATLLKEEEQRVERLTAELEKASDAVQLAVVEAELIEAEFRVENELAVLQKETATQDLLLQNAKVLSQWVKEQIAELEKVTGSHHNQAQQVARALRREEQTLERLSAELVKAQTQRSIETLEVELRRVEYQLYEALRALHFNPNPSTTPAPVTPTEGPVTRTEVPVTHETVKPTGTAGPVTGRPVTRPTVVPTGTPAH